MSRIHSVSLQNKLETHKENYKDNKREVHECDGWSHIMTSPEPKPESQPPVVRHTRRRFHRVCRIFLQCVHHTITHRCILRLQNTYPVTLEKTLSLENTSYLRTRQRGLLWGDWGTWQCQCSSMAWKWGAHVYIEFVSRRDKVGTGLLLEIPKMT